MNEVKYYNSTNAITITPTPILNFPNKQYDIIRAKNEDALDIILHFTSSETGEGTPYLLKAGDDLIHPFKCSGKVFASVASGSTTGNLFVQLTKA